MSRLSHRRLACSLALVLELQPALWCQRAPGPVQREADWLLWPRRLQASEVYQRVGLPHLPPSLRLPPLEWGRFPHLLPQHLQVPQSSVRKAGWHHSLRRAISG